MAVTEIYAFDKNGDSQNMAEVGQSMRGALLVWTQLENRHLPPFTPDWAEMCYGPDELEARRPFSRLSAAFAMADQHHPLLQEIWGIGMDKNVPDNDRIILLSTLDGVYILRQDIPKLIEAYLSFDPNNTLAKQVEAIQALLQQDPELMAIAFNQTSVNEGKWHGTYDEDTDEFTPCNLLKVEGAWDLFKTFNGYKKDEATQDSTT